MRAGCGLASPGPARGTAVEQEQQSSRAAGQQGSSRLAHSAQRTIAAARGTVSAARCAVSDIPCLGTRVGGWYVAPIIAGTMDAPQLAALHQCGTRTTLGSTVVGSYINESASNISQGCLPSGISFLTPALMAARCSHCEHTANCAGSQGPRATSGLKRQPV